MRRERVPHPRPPRGRARAEARAVWRTGEEEACRHLRARGFEVLERNYRHGVDEIDVVARRGRLLVFCEVKARTGTRHGAPEEAVDYRKAARIRRGAAAWLAERRPGKLDVRFDVIAVVLAPAGNRVEHIPDAF